MQSAHCRCLELAIEYQCSLIAFPAISTGVYGYPMDLAAEHSLSAVRDFLIERQQPLHVRFVLFAEGAFGAFSRVLESMIIPDRLAEETGANSPSAEDERL